METFKKITDDLYFVGGSDRKITLFESAYPVSCGMSYNSYLLKGKETVLFDTVDSSVQDIFFENLEAVLKGQKLDFVVVHHMEPDHSATLKAVLQKHRETKVICNNKTKAMIFQFCGEIEEERFITVNEGDSLKLSGHTVSFYLAPMVHWPEVMVSFDETEKILFSADAFGTFGDKGGNFFADEIDFSIDEARRYYTNICGKYGTQVKALLKKTEALDIEYICPLHGPVIRKNIDTIIEKYDMWSGYAPEEKGVLIAYASIYGNTQKAAEILSEKLNALGVETKIYDTSYTHYSHILAEAFRFSHIVLASPTYNGGIFTSMELLLNELKHHNLQNRTAGIIENGSWGPVAGKLMKEILSKMKNITVLEPTITVKSALKEEQLTAIDELAKAFKNSI